MGGRILVVDDEANIRKMMALALESAGYDVEVADDGEQALGVFGNGASWDAVVLDQRMPGLDGLATLGRMKDLAPEVRIVMVTAYASIELAVDAMKLGASDFLRKPMNPEMLRNAVSAALSRQSGARPGSSEAPGDVPPIASVATVTLNGFRIARSLDFERKLAESPADRHFIVCDSGVTEMTVVVVITERAVDQIARMTHRHFGLADSYWTSRAERKLAEVLWTEGRIPWGRVEVGEADRDELDVAARWPRGTSAG